MSEPSQTYCRLCAEETPEEQLIKADDEVGLHSKIQDKLQWINIDLTSERLPKTICYSCFDLLERTWLFLHNARQAQQKLSTIFKDKSSSKNVTKASEAGKPKDVNWKDFVDDKVKVKVEKDEDDVFESINLDEDLPYLKEEYQGNSLELNSASNSSDSEQFLIDLAKTKSKRKKNRKRHTEDCDLVEPKSEGVIIPIEPKILLKKITWEDFTWFCGDCDAQCKSVELLRLHALEIHKTCCCFRCFDCFKISYSYEQFLNHVRKHYTSLKNTCEVCNKHFQQSSLLKKHKKKIHAILYINYCEGCGVSFESEQQYKDHLKFLKPRERRKKNVDSGVLDQQCDICQRKFKTRGALLNHKLLHTQRSRDYSCHMCGKMFYTKGALSTHLAIHEEVKPYKCEYCSMSFRARGNLKAHITIHSEAKPYVCEQCGKSFRVKRHLKSHSIIHTDLMPYNCEYCNKTFRFKTRLNLHVRQHTGAKPYHCELCRRDFTNGSNFKKHMKRRHNIDTSVRKKMYSAIVAANDEQAIDSKENIVDIVEKQE